MADEEKGFEDVLEKYYSPETSDEEKTFIYSMISRLKRVFSWNIKEEGMFNKENGPDIVRNLIIQFNNWRSLICTSNNLLDYVGLQHVAIYTMAKLCLCYWIRDSEIVSEVLRQVYIYDGHFSRMFAQIINQNAGGSLWPAVNQETRQKEYLTMLYFLTHAQNAKLEFSGDRFVDLKLKVPFRFPPVLVAALYNKPESLLLLLRHGAIIDQRLLRQRSYHWDLLLLLRHLIRILWTALGTGTESSSWDAEVMLTSMHERCLCLRFLLRCIPQIPIGQLHFSIANFQQSGIAVPAYSHDFIRSLSERNIVPTLASRYLEPSELRHLCRITIRNALNRNWSLPFGIFALPLPKILKRYVNLTDD